MWEIQLSPRPAEMACLGATEVQWLDCYQPAPVGKAEGSIKVSFLNYGKKRDFETSREQGLEVLLELKTQPKM